ncbi:MAG: polysaccharide biosynthesis/export family protein [Phormidesmis sp.]
MLSSRVIAASVLSLASGLVLSSPSAAEDLPRLSEPSSVADTTNAADTTNSVNAQANEPTSEPANEPASEQPSEQELPSLNQTPPAGDPAAVPNANSASSSFVSRQPLPLSPGDRLRLTIPGLGGEEFSGIYEVNLSGNLEIPYLAPLSAVGTVPETLEQQIRSALIERQLFRPDLLRVSVQVLDYSPIQVSVTGAVFKPGRLLVAENEEATTFNVSGESVEFAGDYPLERYLTSTLLTAGGVQPTADISQVQVLRGTQSTVVDLSGILTGDRVDDVALVAGDQVIVPNKGVFQSDLVRPTQITPETVELYVSNLTEPSGGSNLEGTGNINTASFEYGTNLIQALVAAQCIGGTRSTNANRRALLIQTDVVSGELDTSEYSVQDLVSRASESPDEAPLLMPNDAIACYNSGIVNTRSLFDIVGNFLSPINLLRNIFFND